MTHPPQPRERGDFEIAIICALQLEADAVEALFDRFWGDHGEMYGKAPGDPNAYTTGVIGLHNVVLAHMPGIGKGSAAGVASSFRYSFRGIKLALVVGICGGVPYGTDGEEILLGDVIVSSGLIEYDFGRKFPDQFVRKDTLQDSPGRPNLEIRSLLNKLKGNRSRMRLRDNTSQYLLKLQQILGVEKAQYPGVDADKLFEPTYRHKHYDFPACTLCTKCEKREDEVCETALVSSCSELKCNEDKLVPRSRLSKAAETAPAQKPMIHYGLIASGDIVMKSGEDRDAIATREEVIAFEMEGAGVWDNLPCVVIKGVCDYADSHKNKGWQNYAAAAAAACMKAFLKEWVPAGCSAILNPFEMHDKIRQWLSPPDPSSNFHGAIKQRQANTGLWLLESNQFARWKTINDSVLWLYGKPGCGKTLLSSTIIENITKHCQNNTAQAVAYFYFAFTDTEKQKTENMMRSIITQLSLQCRIPLKAIEDLFSACGNGQRPPSPDTLIKFLQQFINGFDDTFIILDALDECEDRGELLLCLEEILGWRLGTLHIMVTSRPEHDIKNFFESLLDHDQQICIQSALVNDDIRTYVRHRILNDAKLKRWKKQPDVQREIEISLMEKVDGMFRWAACQLDALVTCLNRPRLRAALASLPRTLDETYARILRNINPDYQSDALKILQWLVYSARPLRLEEVVEVLATEPNSEPRFDPDRRFPEPHDILSICSSLTTTEFATDDVPGIGRIKVEELRLAHFSVKEYLMSDRVCEEAKIFRIQEIPASAAITEACLAYLLHFDTQDILKEEAFKDFPLLGYSAKYWMQHARVVDQKTDSAFLLAMELFLICRNAYVNWLRWFDLNYSTLKPKPSKGIRDIEPPLYCASLAGLHQHTKQLLEAGADVNAQGGNYGSALQAASYMGHDAIVAPLLEAGADVNAQGGIYDNALQAASLQGQEAIVALLLEAGANVNAQGRHHGSALQAASFRGLEAIVALLLEAGADVNAQGGHHGSALQAASFRGLEAIVALLLEAGADVNAQGGHYGSALQAASFRGQEAIVALLLEAGADVNAQGGHYGSALQVASFRGLKAIMALLLEAGALPF